MIATLWLYAYHLMKLSYDRYRRVQSWHRIRFLPCTRFQRYFPFLRKHMITDKTVLGIVHRHPKRHLRCKTIGMFSSNFLGQSISLSPLSVSSVSIASPSLSTVSAFLLLISFLFTLSLSSSSGTVRCLFVMRAGFCPIGWH
jgi:hypothetical protein